MNVTLVRNGFRRHVMLFTMLNLFAAAALLSGCCTRMRAEDMPRIFLQEYQQELAALCGGGQAVSFYMLTNEAPARYTCVINCSDPASGEQGAIRFALTCSDRGLIETVAFDRGVMLPDGTAVAPNAPVAVETLIHAFVNARASAEPVADLQVQSAKLRISYGNPDYRKAASLGLIRAKTPTAVTSFDDVTTFAFSLSSSTSTFDYVVNRAEGTIKGKKRNRFVWAAPPLSGSNGAATVGAFMAVLKNDMMTMRYSHRQGNDDGSLMPTNFFEMLHEGMRTNKPARGVFFGSVIFAIDSDLHTATNVPFKIKATKSAISMRNFKLPRKFSAEE